MAFIGRDKLGNRIVSITRQVGLLPNFSLTGTWEDVVVIQELLLLFYKGHASFVKNKPLKIIDVTGRIDLPTVAYIRSFQTLVMKRARPEGYINRYSGGDMYGSTVWRLNDLAKPSLRASGFGSLDRYLKENHPLLFSSLVEGEQSSNYDQSSDRQRANQFDLSR